MKFYGDANLQQNELQNAVLPVSTAFPQSPKVGEVSFVASIVYICVAITNNLPVWVPLTRKITAFTFNQNTAASTWNINHNLNTSSVQVQVFDSSASVIIPHAIEVLSPNDVRITSSTPMTGKAVVLTGHFDSTVTPTLIVTPGYFGATNTTEVGAFFDQTNSVSNGTAPYTFSFEGTLPPNATLNTSTGEVYGNEMTAAGSYMYRIKVVDSNGEFGSSLVNATVNLRLSIISSPPSTQTMVGVPYNQSNTYSNGVSPYSFTTTGAGVPDGLTLDSSTGTVSGVPTTSGPFSYVIQVSDAIGVTDSATVSGTFF